MYHIPIRMNQRIFVEKKSAFDVESHKVLAELQEFTSLTHLKQYVIYDVFDAQEQSWDKLKRVLLDAVADITHAENPFSRSGVYTPESHPRTKRIAPLDR